jgi:hypothetical protein
MQNLGLQEKTGHEHKRGTLCVWGRGTNKKWGRERECEGGEYDQCTLFAFVKSHNEAHLKELQARL